VAAQFRIEQAMARARRFPGGVMTSGRLCGAFGWFARANVALVLAVTLVACSESTPTTPSPNPGAGSGTPPPPAGTTLDILRSQGGSVAVQGVNLPFAGAAGQYNIIGRSMGGFPGRSYAEAAVSIGVNERPLARSLVYYDWSSTPGRYVVSTDVAWSGHFSGNGVLGSGVKMSYELEIRDFRGRLLASRTLHERELQNSGLTLGGFVDQGTTSATVDFMLPANTGGPFRIQLVLTCEAYSGVIGALTFCGFGNDLSIGPANLNGYAEWTALSVTSFP
jgi:hypothetical protein